jgi:NAD(P)-dependent dehydrogenase (short-subunit alcohol dehydrogenase family)
VVQDYRFDGRVAVVTGAAQGIGAEIAKRLLSLGATVVLADRSPAVANTAHELKSYGLSDSVVCDVTDNSSIQNAVDEVLSRYGSVDVLVANAGISYQKEAIEHTDADWQHVMRVNLDGVFFTIRAFARPMLKAKSGAIVAISSIAGVKAVRPEVHVGYDVSKAGVAHLCRILAVEWAQQGVRVNAVGPGYTDTQLLGEFVRANPSMLDVWLSDTPIRRMMRPVEIASAVAFLASDAASGITGHLLMVDGGYSAA